MANLMESLKRIPWLMRVHWIIFSWRGKIWVFRRLKVAVLSFLDLLKVPKQKWTKRAFWRQIFFQRGFRSPEALAIGFRKTLRVCVTYRCNLTCQYCYARGLEKDMLKDMNTDNFLKLILWAKERGWNTIRFLGGEPSVHPCFTKMLGICYKNKMNVSMSTNNIFSSQIASKLNRSWITLIAINYTFDALNIDQKTVFENNLKQLNVKKIPFELSYIIDHQNDNHSAIFHHARFHRPMCIRVSIAIPGLSKQTSVSEINNNFKIISSKIFEFQENCIKLNIPFYIYRPLLPCMFSLEEWQRLKGTFPFICFTRCPLGFMSDYSATVVVNPDLSIFPCIAVFNKGPYIFNFKDRKDISNYYKKNIKTMLSEPLLDSCKNCERYKCFLYDLEKGTNSDLKSCFSEALCQGGCLSFKENAQSLCHTE